MIASTEHKIYQKQSKVGKGSILKSIRIDKGGGKGLIAGAIVLLVFTLPITIFGIIASPTSIFPYIVLVPGIALLIPGIVLKRKRDSSWMSYYQETTGFSEGELQKIDHELADPSVTLVICKSPGAATDNYIACFLTQHYIVMNSIEPYVRRLEDIIAVAYSDSTDFWTMKCLTTQDKEAISVALITDTHKKAALCREIMLELRKRNPKIICGQEIICDGRNYILERDGAELLRLYQEGRPLEPAK